MDLRNQPCEPVSLSKPLVAFGLAVQKPQSQPTATEFDPRIKQKFLTLALILALTRTVNYSNPEGGSSCHPDDDHIQVGRDDQNLLCGQAMLRQAD